MSNSMKNDENKIIAAIDIDLGSNECVIYDIKKDTAIKNKPWEHLLEEMIENGVICQSDVARISSIFSITELKRRIEEDGPFQVQLRSDMGKGIEWITAYVSAKEYEENSVKSIHIEIQNQNIFQLNGRYENDSFLREILFDGFGQCFMNMIYIDVLNDSYVVQNIFGDDSMKELLIQPIGTYTDDNIGYAKNFVHEGDWDLFYKYTSLDYFKNNLNSKGKHHTFRIRHVQNGEFRPVEVHEICTKCEKDNFHVLYFLRDLSSDNNADTNTEVKDRVLSQITQILYGYNLTVDIYTGKYTIIIGNGLDFIVEKLKKQNQFKKVEKLINELVHPDYRKTVNELISLDSLQANSDKSGLLGTVEFPVIYPDSEDLEWHEINVFIGVDENGKTVANILARNITEAHYEKEKHDRELKEAEIANAANAAKTSFLFNMSHDIRTPMNAVIGFTDLLEKNIGNEAKCRDYIQKIQTSSQFLLSLINNVLEMARIESGKAVLDETTWCPEEFNDTLSSVFEEQMNQKNIEFVRNVDVQHHYVFCDSLKLSEIYLNILSNAYKYTLPGGRISMEIKELPTDKEGYAFFQTTITDTGIGMSKEYLPHLFEEFTREKTTTDNKIEGSGLGMPIVKRLVELMGGSITVESEVGKGTTFVVKLHHKISDKSALNNADKSDINTEDFNGKKILLAEDNDLNAEIAIAILEDAGFVVERAEDGLICIDMLQRNAPHYYDLILMDIQMPNMDGYKATRTIRDMSDSCKCNIPIIAMTANAFGEDRKAALEAGMNGHLAKPIKIDELMKTLAKIFSHKTLKQIL